MLGSTFAMLGSSEKSGPELNTHVRILAYADDVDLPEESEKELQLFMNELNIWFEHNKLNIILLPSNFSSGSNGLFLTSAIIMLCPVA